MALPEIRLRIETEQLRELTEKLAGYGYHEKAISELVGRWDLSEMTGEEYPSYIWRCRRAGTDLSELVSVMLLGQGTTRERLVELLGRDLVGSLEECGVILGYEGLYTCQPCIYPCLEHFILTDQWAGHGEQEPGKVYELGTDSYVIARVTPRTGVKTALDLCTGSGVHAVMSATTAELSRAVDINPRALMYTKFNAALNGVKVETFLGDLYTPVADRQYDLITANPPFVPSPDPKVLVHRSAGETGEEVPERLVNGLQEHLAPGGLFSMVLEHPVFEDETYLDRLERWVGEKHGWGIYVLLFNEVPIGQYIYRHLGGVSDYEETYKAYLNSYLDHGIRAVRFVNVFIRRMEPDRENFKCLQKTPWPNISLVDQVEEWLHCVQTYTHPDWKPDPNWKPALSPNYKTVWRDWDDSKGVLEVADHNWFQPEPLNAHELNLINSMKTGDKKVEELQKEWLAQGLDESSFDLSLRGLGIRRALRLPP